MVKMLKWQKDGMGFEVLCTLRYHHMGSFKTPWCTQCRADLTQSLFLTLEVQLLFFDAWIYFVAALEYVLDFHSWCFCFLLHLKFCYVMCNRWPPYAPFVTCKWERIGNFLDIGGIEGVWFEDETLCGQPWDNLMIRLTTCLLSWNERDDLCKDWRDNRTTKLFKW